MLRGKKILLGVTGSIAAYKSAVLVRLLVKQGAEVKVVITPAARDFVTPLTLSTLSKHPVLQDLFEESTWSNHVMLGRWADVMLIAPLSCNTLAKMAQGLCDNLLLATWLSATCPVVVAPAMDEDMWKHPSTQRNLRVLEGYGNRVIPVESGELASGLVGEGRMAEPEYIVEYLEKTFFGEGPLKGKKALVTAGPTYEPIDPVRFIGNFSSGKMGTALARELDRRGAEVTLVMGPSQEADPGGSVRTIRVTTAEEMFRACETSFQEADLAIMAAAVADYTPATTAPEKIKKKDRNLQLDLVKTTDILKTLGQRKTDRQLVVGFALETNDEAANAQEKLSAKNADMIVLNSLRDEGAGFGHATNKITIFDKSGRQFPFGLQSKEATAAAILDTITRLYYE